MLPSLLKEWRTATRICRGYVRHFSEVAGETSYKRVRLCDKPPFSLCRESAELLRQGTHLAVLLDGHVLESPLGNVIRTESLPVAERILSEWRGQLGQLTRFHTVPTTMLLAETLDLKPDARDDMVESLVDGLKFDTVLRFDSCPAVELPPLDKLDDGNLSQIAKLDIDVLQSSYILPILQAFSRRRGTSTPVTSGSITSNPQQPSDVEAVVRETLCKCTNGQLIAAWKIHISLKSVILPLELMDGAITATQAVRAARLEETLQAANWGVSDTFRDQEEKALLEIETSLFFQRLHSDSVFR